MKRVILSILLLFIVGRCYSRQQSDIHIAWIKEDISPEESAAVQRYLSEEGFGFEGITFKALTSDYLRKHHITHIWWHKDMPGKVSAEAQGLGEVIKNFVRQGGHLVLSMEAVLELHAWGIEKNKPAIRVDTVRDEGFGRPCGFHAFLSHPLFDGLHGGGYIWKGKEDNIVRKIGYFGDRLPDTSSAKVIGIGWTYITFHEDEKLLWEYHIGKGSILAIGAYSYFSRPNFNVRQLDRFYNNVFRYTAGDSMESAARYWSFAPIRVVPDPRKLKPLPLIPATRWELPPFTLQLARRKATDHFVDVVGRRTLLMGKERGGIEEIWMHPFMAFRDIKTAVVMQGADSVVWLDHLTPRVTVTPEMLIRHYALGKDTLREVITVGFDRPLAVLHYEWTSNCIRTLWIRYTSNLRLMWPYSDTCAPVMHYQWSPEMNAAIVGEPQAGKTSIIGFSNRPQAHQLGRYDHFLIRQDIATGVPSPLYQVSGIFRFDAKELAGKLNVYMTAGDAGDAGAITTFRQAADQLNNLYQQSSTYYSQLLTRQLMITSPDRKFNEGYRWALIRSNQFLQTTPGIGSSMMAGFGTTARGWNGRQRVSGRPGYAWYFGRDGAWSAMALDALGDVKKVKNVLEMFVRFQDVDGKIFHELTSSGAVHYDAADATPLFVILAEHYLKHSGDTGYIRKIWPAIRRAMNFCYSTDTDHDGLIENTNVGHGWIEGGPLFGTHTEFYLAGSWAAALDGAAYLSDHLGLKKLSAKYQRDAVKVKSIVDRDFWSPGQQHFFNGKMTDGSYMHDATVLASVPIYLDAVTDTNKAWLTTGPFSDSRFSADWGMRIIPEDNPKYSPGAYHAGMVWPLFSGYAALAEYKTGRYVAGFTHLMSNLNEYRDGSLGSVEETLRGDVYQPAGVCSQQGWSETMVIQPAIEGMLGFYPDAVLKRVKLSPCFPWDWDRVKTTNIRCGRQAFSMQMLRMKDSYQYSFVKKEEGILSLDFHPVLPPGTLIDQILIQGKSTPYKIVNQHEAVKVILPSLSFHDRLEIQVLFHGGTGVLPKIYIPASGAHNTGAKIVAQHWQSHQYTFTVEGVPGETYELGLFSMEPPTNIQQGRIHQTGEHTYIIRTIIPQSEDKYGRQTIIVNV